MRFFTNLQPNTIEIYEQVGYASSSWLLSSHRASNSALRLTADLQQQNAELMADNGTKPLIDIVLKEFKDPTREVWLEFRDYRKKQGEPSMSSMPDTIRDLGREFAKQITNRVDEIIAEQDWQATLDKQLEMQPTHLIAPEDFCIGCLMGLKLDRNILGWSLDQYTKRNHISLDGWEFAQNDPRAQYIHVYVTLAAADYYSAKKAALAAAQRGAKNVAVGFAGLNHLQTATQWTSLTRRYKLDKAAGTRYVKLIEILLGIRDGYREANVQLERFHGLGLGSRAQYPILSTVLDEWTDISVDATSPIKDAVNARVLYNHENQGRNNRVDHIALEVIKDDPTCFNSPFITDSKQRHGHSPEQARQWWESINQRKISMEDLKVNQPLATALGWLASDSGSLTSTVTDAWIGHNHWVCDFLAQRVPEQGKSAWGKQKIQALLSNQSSTITRAANAWLQILTIHSE